MAERSNKPKLKIQPATKARWDDIEHLFGERGACGGCWCMFWRVTRKEFDEGKGAKNKSALKRIVTKGQTPPGVLVYVGSEPAGWCAIAPRQEYIGLESSRILKLVDDKPVWSVSCLFIKRPYRRKGISTLLLRAAIEFQVVKSAVPFKPRRRVVLSPPDA